MAQFNLHLLKDLLRMKLPACRDRSLTSLPTHLRSRVSSVSTMHRLNLVQAIDGREEISAPKAWAARASTGTRVAAFHPGDLRTVGVIPQTVVDRALSHRHHDPFAVGILHLVILSPRSGNPFSVSACGLAERIPFRFAPFPVMDRQTSDLEPLCQLDDCRCFVL